MPPENPQPETIRLINLYLRTLSTPQTKKTYNTEIWMFVRYLGEERSIEELRVEDLSGYREVLAGRYAPATVAKKLAVLRRFLVFAYMSGQTRLGPEEVRYFARSPRVHQDSAYNVLTQEEVGRMLSAARVRSHRDYAMLAVMAGCGLREAEVVGLKVGDFQEVGEEQILLRVRGKGEKVRAIPISPELWRLVQQYVVSSERSFTSHQDARKPMFISRVGKDKPLTTRSIQNIVKKYARAAGITKPISPHSLRHTVGTNMAVNEAPLLLIQQFLGHADPKTTLRYIRRAEEMAGKAYQYNTLPI